MQRARDALDNGLQRGPGGRIHTREVLAVGRGIKGHAADEKPREKARCNPWEMTNRVGD